MDASRIRLRLGVSMFLLLSGSVFVAVGLFLLFRGEGRTPVGVERPVEDQGVVVQIKDGEGDQGGVILVDVAGAVSEPGLYTLPVGASVAEALRLAGGFVDQTDKYWVARRLNMAEKLVDRQKIYIPFVGEQTTSESDSLSVKLPPMSANKLIDLNLAAQTELESLPGVGSKRAEAIIKGRPYHQSGDLLERKILGERTYALIKDLVTVGGG